METIVRNTISAVVSKQQFEQMFYIQKVFCVVKGFDLIGKMTHFAIYEFRNTIH